MELTIGDIADATGATVVAVDGGEASSNAPLRTAAIDSRLVEQGDLFVALPGARTDGARFVGDAYARGAAAALTTTPPAISAAQSAARTALSADVAPLVALIVPDVLAALQRSAAEWRARHAGVRVVGVTGSVGKTTTREAIASVLSSRLPTLVSPRSYNNEIGLPLTLLGLESTHKAAVLEMGMYARGEIAALCALSQPQIGVVTMIAPIHLERLGSIEEIARAKAELVEALPPNGLAVLNGDDARVRAMAAHTTARAVFFGRNEDNDWRASDIVDRGLSGFGFTLSRGRQTARVETALVGVHFVHALLAAAAVADALGLPFDTITTALGQVRIGERQRFLHGPTDWLIIDDSWNASVPSMLAALDVLAAVPRRRVAILGEMLELGAESDTAHRTVGQRAGAVVQALVAVGRGGAIMADAACRAGLARASVETVLDPAEVPRAARALLQSGDAILVKGSRGLRLEETVRWLMMP